MLWTSTESEIFSSQTWFYNIKKVYGIFLELLHVQLGLAQKKLYLIPNSTEFTNITPRNFIDFVKIHIIYILSLKIKTKKPIIYFGRRKTIKISQTYVTSSSCDVIPWRLLRLNRKRLTRENCIFFAKLFFFAKLYFFKICNKRSVISFVNTTRLFNSVL